MPVKIPVGRGEMHFNIADDTPPFSTDFENRVLEVGSGFQVPDAGADDRHLAAAARDQVLRPQGGIIPDGLNMSLGQGVHWTNLS